MRVLTKNASLHRWAVPPGKRCFSYGGEGAKKGKLMNKEGLARVEAYVGVDGHREKENWVTQPITTRCHDRGSGYSERRRGLLTYPTNFFRLVTK